MSDDRPPPSAPRIAMAQGLVLTLLCLLAFRHECLQMLRLAAGDREMAHLLVMPLLVTLLFWRRRQALAESITRGSAWGLGLIAAGLLLRVASSWPFNFGTPRWAAMVPVLAGVILIVGGWRVLKLCLPMLLILTLAIPMTGRHYAFLTIKPETLTLEAVRGSLDLLLPGVYVELEGPDMNFVGEHGSGTIALGEPNRGASLLLAFLTIGAFVTFAKIRPFGQLIGLGVAAIPIVLLCNYARLAVWGLVTIYGGAAPLDASPRIVATLTSLVLAYGLFALVTAVMARLVTTTEDSHG